MHDAPPYWNHPLPRQRSSRVPMVLSVVNLLIVLAVGGLLTYASEEWWLSVPLVYAPKAPLAVPAALLLLYSLAMRPRLIVVNLASLLLVAGPIMGFVAPVARLSDPPPVPQAGDLRLVSCNIQGFQPNFPLVIGELGQFQPDIVVFQEVRGDEDHPLLAKTFATWNIVRDDYYFLASKYPAKLIHLIESPTFERNAGLLVEVTLPSGPVFIADVHLMTARRSLVELTPGGLFNGDNQATIESHQLLREEEMLTVRQQIDERVRNRPLIVLGDFNTPASSSLFQRHWGGLQSAFDSVGFGYGYTSPCRKHRFWFENTPWVRIDHVLCSHDWEIVRSDIGTLNGSDHRLVAATVRLIDAVENPVEAELRKLRDRADQSEESP